MNGEVLNLKYSRYRKERDWSGLIFSVVWR